MDPFWGPMTALNKFRQKLGHQKFYASLWRVAETRAESQLHVIKYLDRSEFRGIIDDEMINALCTLIKRKTEDYTTMLLRFIETNLPISPGLKREYLEKLVEACIASFEHDDVDFYNQMFEWLFPVGAHSRVVIPVVGAIVNYLGQTRSGIKYTLSNAKQSPEFKVASFLRHFRHKSRYHTFVFNDTFALLFENMDEFDCDTRPMFYELLYGVDVLSAWQPIEAYCQRKIDDSNECNRGRNICQISTVLHHSSRVFDGLCQWNNNMRFAIFSKVFPVLNSKRVFETREFEAIAKLNGKLYGHIRFLYFTEPRGRGMYSRRADDDQLNILDFAVLDMFHRFVTMLLNAADFLGERHLDERCEIVPILLETHSLNMFKVLERLPANFRRCQTSLETLPRILDRYLRLIDVSKWRAMIATGDNTDFALRIMLLSVLAGMHKQATQEPYNVEALNLQDRLLQLPLSQRSKFLTPTEIGIIERSRIFEKVADVLWSAIGRQEFAFPNLARVDFLSERISEVTLGFHEDFVIHQLVSDDLNVREAGVNKLKPSRRVGTTRLESTVWMSPTTAMLSLEV
ncbi:unnamed protein product [Caenorhabditis bovis]|uniref:Uncharacterized protein n=1 Tax=Caenorhabditis bovis TaxID=2654633 RepID=A0A8S1FFM2_9PELO|nr:unnamed protein product [Caenorhabditis bovis]